MAIKEVKIMSPQTFLDEMSKILHIEQNALKMFYERLSHLCNTLELSDTHEIMAL